MGGLAVSQTLAGKEKSLLCHFWCNCMRAPKAACSHATWPYFLLLESQASSRVLQLNREDLLELFHNILWEEPGGQWFTAVHPFTVKDRIVNDELILHSKHELDFFVLFQSNTINTITTFLW